MNELIHSVEETKLKINNTYQKNLSLLNENSNHKSQDFEPKSSLILSTQNFIKKKRQLLNDVKNGQALLYQYDIEQIKLYRTIIREYEPTKIEVVPSPSTSSASSFNFTNDSDSDEDYYHKSNKTLKRTEIMNYYGQCPLTCLGIYGLNEKHNVHLCSSEGNKSDYHLMTHFYNYHHIKWIFSSQLIDAIKKKSDPYQTHIFPANVEILDKRFYVIRCPLIDINYSSCKKKFFKNSLEQHLLNIHHLSSITTKKILQIIQTKGHLTAVDFDEKELK